VPDDKRYEKYEYELSKKKGMMNGMSGMMGWGMWFIPLLIIVLITVLVISLYKNNSISAKNETPLEILKKRYAKGEITNEQFEKMKNNIS